MADNKCPYCGFAAPDYASFCPVCGHKLAATRDTASPAADAPSAAAGTFCPVCGARRPEDAKECPVCGCGFGDEAVAVEPVEPVPESKAPKPVPAVRQPAAKQPDNELGLGCILSPGIMVLFIFTVLLLANCPGHTDSPGYADSDSVAKDSTSVIVDEEHIYVDYTTHDYVDLGLPSGVKWATCNVGASSPSGYGTYYAWGEVHAKKVYTLENSRTDGMKIGDISGNATYDVARAKWGGSWRLPTEDECAELLRECTREAAEMGGQKGYRFIGPNGNSIFLPAAGSRSYASTNYEGIYCDYWSSTPIGDGHDAYCFSEGVVGGSSRYFGRSVRPVSY